MPNVSTQACDIYAAPLTDACVRADITSKLRLANFLAQIGHESGDLRYVKENLNYGAPGLRSTFPKYFPDDATAALYQRNPEAIANKVYANRMGNGPESSGDGWRYRGRGLIQITGKDNYLRCLAALEQDNPDWLETPEGAAESAVWFWTANRLNEPADLGDIKKTSKIINGGYHGLEDRISRYEQALAVL